VKFDGPEFIKFGGELGDENILNIRMSILEDNFGDHEGLIMISHEGTQYRVPFLLHYTPGSVSANQQNEKLSFDIFHPEIITTTPEKKASIEVYENAEYWIDAKIRVNGNTSNAFDVIKVDSLDENQERINIIDIPEKQIGIISIVIIGIAVFGLIKRK
jgi:minor extracellular serine protease Vpr